MSTEAKNWKCKDFFDNSVWFHATQIENARKILKYGINVKINIKNELDFGYGFYLTPNFLWAKKYIQEITAVVDEDSIVDPNDGCILQFSFRPSDYIDKYTYKFFPNWSEEFASFVFKNRVRYKQHFFTHVSAYNMEGDEIDVIY